MVTRPEDSVEKTTLRKALQTRRTDNQELDASCIAYVMAAYLTDSLQMQRCVIEDDCLMDLLRLRSSDRLFLRWLRRMDRCVLELDLRLAGGGHSEDWVILL